MTVRIHIIDHVHSSIDPKGIKKIKPCVEFKSERWYTHGYGMGSTTRKDVAINKDGTFLTGLVPRIKEYCTEKNIEAKVIRGRNALNRIRFIEPNVKGIETKTKQGREQFAVLEKIKENRRGVVLFPTGSGKTVIAALVISSLNGKNILFLCHTKDIFFKTRDAFKNYGFKKVAMYGGGIKDDIFSSSITLAMIQSFAKIDPRKYCSYYDCVIVDEAHHINSLDSQYGHVLQRMLASVRLGFTATLHSEKEKQLNLEGLMGPVIANMTQREAIKKEILAKPIFSLINVPYNTATAKYYRYRDLYEWGIVKNRVRNRLIIKEVLKYKKRGMTSLILIKEIEHGEQILKLAKLSGLKAQFVHGGTVGEQREAVAGLLNDKKVFCVIASVIWKEGIDIPSLDHVVNAFGGKGEIPTVQVPGRGQRTDKGKKSVFYVTDFLDPYKFLSQHAVFRLQIYKSKGWLNH